MNTQQDKKTMLNGADLFVFDPDLGSSNALNY